MATSCAIIKQRDDGLWYESSIRSDGFLTGVGVTLWKWYQDPAHIDRLIDCGWVSPLECKVEFHEANKRKVHKDDIRKHTNRAAAIASGFDNGVVFLFENGHWVFIDQNYNQKTGEISAAEEVVIDREMLLKANCCFKLTDEMLDDRTEPKPFWKTMDDDWQKLIAENTNPDVTYYGGNGVYGVSTVAKGFPKPLPPEARDPDRYEKLVEHIKAVVREIELSPDHFGPAFGVAQDYAIHQFGFANTPEAEPFYDPRARKTIDLTSVEVLKSLPESAMALMVPMYFDERLRRDLDEGAHNSR